MESGTSIDDEIILGIVFHGLQDQATRDHVFTTSDTVRTELLEMAGANRVLQQMPVPMDISAAPYKGKGKGKKGDTKGKDPKGKGKRVKIKGDRVRVPKVRVRSLKTQQR